LTGLNIFLSCVELIFKRLFARLCILSMGSSSSRLAGLYEYIGAKAISRQITDQASIEEVCRLLGSSGVSGGGSAALGGTCIGGYDALADYGNSLYSKAKEDLIRNIARDVFRALKSSSAEKVTGAKISEVVEQLSKLVPDPRKGKNFNAEFAKSAGKQTEVCKALGASINSNYGARIINVDADPNEICRQVSEVMYSLFTGLHSEFMSVAGDVQRILKNMDTVSTALEAAYKKQKEYVNASGDEATKRQSENTDALYDEIKKEAQRQRVMLQNLFNVVVLPSTKELVNSLEENQDFAGLVSSLKAQTGTREFSDKLSMLLSGISSVARNAELINKALKKLGMSTSEFKASKTSDDLHMKIYSKIVAAKPDSKRLGEMMKAANIVYANNYNHDAVSRIIDKSGDKSDDQSNNESVEGGAEDDAPAGYWRNKSLDRKIKDKKKFRETMLKDFNRLLSGQYRVIVDSANGIAQEIGKSIQLGPELDHFINVFKNLPSLDRNNLHIALSGYYKDAQSKENRSQFVDKYMLVLRAIEQMPKSDSPAQFGKMSAGIKTMLKSLDEFSDNIVKALTEIHVDAPYEVKNGRRMEVAEFLGGSDSGDDLFNGGTWVDFKKIQNELAYYRSIANIKINISRTLSDRREYAEGYEQTLGEYSGKLIDSITSRYKALIDAVDKAPDGAAVSPDTKWNNDQRNSPSLVHQSANSAAHANGPELKSNLKKIYTTFQTAKVNMVKVAQAVDLYMKAFSVGISSNPDILSSTVKMLESVEMVAKWYTDKSGNNLVRLFESFPVGTCDEAAGAAAPATPGIKPFFSGAKTDINSSDAPKIETFDKTYYETLEDRRINRPNHLPANPFVGARLNYAAKYDVNTLFKLSEDSIKTMRALENILSAFQSVGSKFGDLDPQAQTFMSPGQMFNYLCDYVKAAAFTTEFLPTKPRTLGAVYRSTMDAVDITTERGLNTPVPARQILLRPQSTQADCLSTDNIAYGANPQLSISQTHAYNAAAVIAGHEHIGVPPVGHVVKEVKSDDVYGLMTGVSNTTNHVSVGATALDDAAVFGSGKYTTVALAAIPADSHADICTAWQYHAGSIDDAQTADMYRVDLAGWRDHFYDTDMLFTMTIKSIVAKVFTVVDAYRLFHRPSTERRAYSVVAPVRTILGGGPEVKVIPEALELYYRMPLLVEWYREMFRIDRIFTGPKSEYHLTMAPTIDGTFGDLTQIICEDGGNISEGNYTETQVQRIIAELNNIWKQYKAKAPKATARHIINAYVLEINRVIGFIKQDDITEYLKDRRARYSNSDNPVGSDETDDFLNFDILGADKQYATNRPAPSDRFTSTSLTNKATSVSAVTGLMQQIYKMRERMDKEFNRFMIDDRTPADFGITISNYKSELDLAKDPASEYKIVLRMMQGSSKLVEDNVDVMIMVHEAVAAPLATLYAIWRVMAKFNALMHGVSLVNIGEWNTARIAVGAATNINDNNNAYTEYVAYFAAANGKYKNRSNANIFGLFASMLLGNYFTGAGVPAQGAAVGVGCNPFNAGFFQAQAGTGAIQPRHLKSDMMLQVLLSAVLDLYSNPSNLTSCSIGANGNINIDYKPLRDTCAVLLGSVKSNILALRSSFSSSAILDKYENYTTPGSLRWIEENLMEILFNDRDQCGLNTGITSHLIPTIAKLCNSLSADASLPVRPEADSKENYGSMHQAFAGLIYYRHSLVNAGQHSHARFNSMKFPFNMSQKEPFSIGPGKTNINVDYHNTPAMAGGAAKDHFSELNPFLNIPTIAFVDYEHLNKLNPAAPVKSLMVAFNQFLRHYIYCNSDENTLKTYMPLYESFASGPAAYEIGQKNAFQDIFEMKHETALNPANVPFNVGDAMHPPGQKSIIFNSNAVVIRQIITGEQLVGSVIKRAHLYENFAEIPESLRDKMKTNLPYFSKMFQQLYNRAEFLFKFLNNSNVKAHVERAVIAGATAPDVAQTGTLRSGAAVFSPAGALTSKDAAVYLTAQLTKIMELCTSIRKCADSVYRELNDKPYYYMETNRDFITDYKSRTGNIPFMPVSSLLAPLRMFEVKVSDWNSNTDSAGQLLLPVIETSSTVFKFNAGCKIIMARDDLEPNIDQMPGAKEIFNHYNSHATGTKIAASDYASCVKNMVQLIRYVVNGAVYNRFFDSPTVSFDLLSGPRDIAALVPTVATVGRYTAAVSAAPDAISAHYMAIYQMGAPAPGSPAAANIAELNAFVNNQNYNASGIFASLHWTATQFGPTQYDAAAAATMTVVPINTEPSKVLELTESTSIRFSKDYVKNVIKLDSKASTSATTRADLRTANILDMNIVPINVHAFMREVPFVNLLNYSYTFDRMAHEFIHPEYYSTEKATIMIPANADISSTRELMVKLLVHPYADLGYDGKQYYALLASLFNGNDNMRLGIAKYLSDQLWHKVLLTSSAQLVKENDDDGFPSLEAGPSAYEATRSIIQYGTKTDSTNVSDAGFLHIFAVTAPPAEIFRLSSTLNVCATGEIGTLNNAGAHDIDSSLTNTDIVFAAATDAEGAAGAMATDNGGAGPPSLTATYQNPTTALSAGLLGNTPAEHVALAMVNTVIFNDLSTANIYLKFRAHQTSYAQFRTRLNELVFGPRIGPLGNKGGGIAFQANSAEALVRMNPFTAFIRKSRTTVTAGLAAGLGAPLDTIRATCVALIGNGGVVAAGANDIGHGIGAQYTRDARAAVAEAAAATAADTLTHLTTQLQDLMHACFVTHAFGAAPTAAEQKEADEQRVLLNAKRKAADDIDITATGIIPTSIRAEAVGVAPLTHGMQFRSSLAFASTTDILSDMHAHFQAAITALPGAGSILVVFNEMLNLMRPFRNNKALRNLANTYFLGSLFGVTIAGMTTYLAAGELTTFLGGQTKKWVEYVVRYMANRFLTANPAGAAGAPTSYLLGAGGGIPGGLSATVLIRALFVTGTGIDVCTGGGGGTTAVVVGGRPNVEADFLLRIQELIAMSYCNPFLVVEELIPRALQNDRSNIYLSIAALPNMTKGLKVRGVEKGKKNVWKQATKNPMETEDVIYCAEVGRARFDTKIVRNLTWFVQLQRVMRVVLTNHLSWINSPVVRGLKIADASMTELHGNDGYDPEAFTGANYKGRV
jgi:hypothetical protein